MQIEHSSKLQPASLNKSRMCRGFRRDGVLKIYQSAAKALLVKKRFKIFQNLVEVVKIERFSKREVQQVQTKKIQTLSSLVLPQMPTTLAVDLTMCQTLIVVIQKTRSRVKL